MKSRILSKIDFDESLIAQDIEKILQFKTEGSYGCFLFGSWNSFPLWNSSGDAEDALLNQYEGDAKKTSYAQELPYVNHIVETHFNTEKLKWIRVFLLENGHVIPHVDFLESGEFTRIHIAMYTDMSCLHAQSETVFHMNEGEVWYLDATDMHSACAMSGIKRIQLCLDFEPIDSFDEIFSKNHQINREIAPTIINRQAINEDFMNTIYNLSAIISKNNFRDIIQFLSKLHFDWNVPVGGIFDWIVEISKRSGQKELLDKALAYKKYCIEERTLGEDFYFFNV